MESNKGADFVVLLVAQSTGPGSVLDAQHWRRWLADPRIGILVVTMLEKGGEQPRLQYLQQAPGG